MWTEFVPMSIAAIRMRNRDLEGEVAREIRAASVDQFLKRGPRTIIASAGAPDHSIVLFRHPTMTVQRLRDALWLKRLSGISRLWKVARKGDPDGVHQLRVASRRIREALPIVSDGHHPRRVRRMRRTVRSLTRTLGPVRECDVSLLLLAGFERAHPEDRSAIQLVRQAIVAQRKDLQERLRDHLDSLTPQELSRKLTKATRRKTKTSAAGDGGPKPAGSEERWRLRLAARIVRRSKQLEQVVEHAGALYAPDRLHGVRVSVKKLRYALELGQEARLARFTPAIRLLKRMQDNLGELQDREGLLDRVRTVHAAQDAVDSQSLERLTRLLEEETRLYHARFVSHREDLLKLCADVRRQASKIVPIGPSLPKRLAKASHRRASRPRIAADRASRR
jgi:CHAD domain-containing protein